MRMRPVLALAALAFVVAGCAPTPEGPAAPIAQEEFGGVPALDASAARQTVVDFVDAYAASATEGVAPLARLVAGTELGSWVRWLAIQHQEFTGSIEGAADIRDVEFVGSLEAARVTGAEVALSATVTFSYAPRGADAFERSRILDGPVTLVRTDAGDYRVIDLTRDGVPMSDGIQRFRRERRTDGKVTVTLDSLFMFEPNWQFNVIIANPTGHRLTLDEQASGLFVTKGGSTERVGGAFTAAVESVPPTSEVPGILAFPLQDEAKGRTLSLVYRGGAQIVRFTFPLDGLVDALPPAPPSGASGATGIAPATGPSGPSGASGSTA